MDFDDLNQYYRQHRATFPESFRLRIHRALSWLARAQIAAADHRTALENGGATWNSSANRSQLRNGYAFLAACIPAILYIMMQHPDLPDWGKPFYPFVRE